MNWKYISGKLTSAEARVRNCLATADASSPLPIERANIQRDAKGVPYSVNLLLKDIDSSFVKLLKVAFNEGLCMCVEYIQIILDSALLLPHRHHLQVLTLHPAHRTAGKGAKVKPFFCYARIFWRLISLFLLNDHTRIPMATWRQQRPLHDRYYPRCGMSRTQPRAMIRKYVSFPIARSYHGHIIKPLPRVIRTRNCSPNDDDTTEREIDNERFFCRERGWVGALKPKYTWR